MPLASSNKDVLAHLLVSRQSNDGWHAVSAVWAFAMYVFLLKHLLLGIGAGTLCWEVTSVDATCASTWPTFSQGVPLTRSSVLNHNASRQASSRRRAQWNHVFVHPKSKFAFCIIEKNGCTTWSSVFNKLVYGRDGRNYNLGRKVHSKEKEDAVFNDPSAVRAVMVRDPLARFASAFLNKCFDQGCKNSFCAARKRSRRGKPISFATAVEWMLSRKPRTLDPHWQLQSEHCDLRTRLGEYTVIGLMSKSSFSDDARCILEMANISHTNRDRNGKPIFYTGRQSSISEEDMLKRMFTPEAARALVRHMRQDYNVFQLQEPAWTSAATGELYAKVAPSCKVTFYRECGKNVRGKEPCKGVTVHRNSANLSANLSAKSSANSSTKEITIDGWSKVYGNRGALLAATCFVPFSIAWLVWRRFCRGGGSPAETADVPAHP